MKLIFLRRKLLYDCSATVNEENAYTKKITHLCKPIATIVNMHIQQITSKLIQFIKKI